MNQARPGKFTGIRAETLAMVMALVVVLTATAFVIARFTFYDRFIHHEREMMREEAHELVALLTQQLERLAAVAGDWGPWDDTYRFLRGENPDFVSANLEADTLHNLGVDRLVFLGLDGQVVHAAGIDRETVRPAAVREALLEQATLLDYARHAPAEFHLLSGLLRLPDGLALIAAAPVLTSDRGGPPAGVLVAVRRIDAELVAAWQSALPVRILPLPAAAVNEDPEVTAAASDSASVSRGEFGPVSYTARVRPLDSERIEARIALTDLSGVSAAAFRIEGERELYRQGRATMSLFSLVVGFSALIVGGFFLFILDRQVLRRLRRLTDQVMDIAQARSLKKRLQVGRLDELGQLAAAGNDLMDMLERTTRDLVARERDLHTVLESNPAAIVLVDIESRTVTWANGNALDLIGALAEAVFQQRCRRFMCPAEAGACPVLDLDQSADASESTLLTVDGRQVLIYKRTARINHHGRPHLLEAFFDITRQKDLERDLRRAQNMEMLGVLAGGVAHDLNNSLMALVGYPDLMLAQIEGEHPFRKPLEAVRTSAQRAAELVEDLLTLARRNVASHEPISVNRLVEEYGRSPQVRWLEAQHPEVAFAWDLPAGEIRVLGSRAHLIKVIMNLVHNGAEAITGAGRVEVGLKVAELTAEHSGLEPIPAGRYALLEVADTGCGLAEADRSRIFEPFFSRKTLQRSGTGLGMTVVWNCVKDMAGFIDVTSELGRGTCFRIYLPLLERDAEAQAMAAPDLLPRGHGERVLVVEDLAEQRQVFEHLLTALGYRVEHASGPEDAAAFFQEGPPDVCIIDMFLGDGPDGLDLYQTIIDRVPSQKAIITSGFAATERVEKALRLGAGGFLKKPFTPGELAKMLRAVLEPAPLPAA